MEMRVGGSSMSPRFKGGYGSPDAFMGLNVNVNVSGESGSDKLARER
jgi:hypothetical protein